MALKHITLGKMITHTTFLRKKDGLNFSVLAVKQNLDPTNCRLERRVLFKNSCTKAFKGHPLLIIVLKRFLERTAPNCFLMASRTYIAR